MSQETKTILTVGATILSVVTALGVGACNQVSRLREETRTSVKDLNVQLKELTNRVTDLAEGDAGTKAQVDLLIAWTASIQNNLQQVRVSNQGQVRVWGAMVEPEPDEASREWRERVETLQSSAECPSQDDDRNAMEWVSCVLASGKAGRSDVPE